MSLKKIVISLNPSLRERLKKVAEIYLPLFFNGKITVISFLENFDQVLLDQNVEKELKEYQSLIEERFEEYRYDIKRPLLEPRDIFLTNKEYEIFLSGCEVLQIKFQEPKVKKVTKETRKLNPINQTPSHQIPLKLTIMLFIFFME